MATLTAAHTIQCRLTSDDGKTWKQQSMVGWLGFNSTFSTNRPYRAKGKVKLC